MILVTGGTGLLGAHLLLKLVKEGQFPIALKRPSSSIKEVKKVFSYYLEGVNEIADYFDRISWVDADLLDREALEEILGGGEKGKAVNEVYHCAAMVSFQPADRSEMIAFNTECTAAMVDACINVGIKKLVHVSSTSAIGRPPEGNRADESMIWASGKSATGYSESKYRSEMEVWRGMESGLPAVIVNPAIILGPGFWNKGSSSMFRRVARGMRFSSTGVTGYVGVEDVVLVMMKLMHSDLRGERFILSEASYSYLLIFEQIAASLRIKRKFKTVSPGQMKYLVHIDRVLGFFTGKRRITSQHKNAAFSEIHYSSQKIKEATGIEFTPVKELIQKIGRIYLDEHQRAFK